MSKQHTTKQTITSIPVLGYVARLASNLVNLPKIHDQLAKEQTNNQHAFSSLRNEYNNLEQENNELLQRLSALQLTQDSIQQQLSIIESSQTTTGPVGQNKPKSTELFADDHMLDTFYTAFEDKFRGTEEMIMERQEEYLPYFTKSKLNFSKHPVLDIGSGRGEFVQLMENNKISAVGLDINHDMVERSKKKGLKAVQGDALSHLQSVKPQTYGAITGFHIVEHIPFNVLLRIFASSLSALSQNGFIILETPNPENLTVGSTTFYMDPSHLHPIPPALLAFTLELAGFRDVEILRIHPHENLKDSKLSNDVAELLYGARDYAVIGYK